MKKNNSSFQLLLTKAESLRVFSSHDLSIASGMQEASVRYHIRKFLKMGLIEALPNPESKLKAGRKEQKYRKSDHSINPNICQLFNIMLRHLILNDDEDNIASVLAKLIIENDETVIKKIPFSFRELVSWLTTRNYQASWVAGKTGPVLHFKNCPYRNIRAGNDILCQMDIQLLQLLNDANWEAVSFMNWEMSYGSCQFQIKPGA